MAQEKTRVSDYRRGVEAARQLVLERAKKWNEHAKIGHPGDCAESLADECEDIALALKHL